MTYEVGQVVCSEPGCEKSFKDHQWGRTKAHKDGWFTQKDGTAWCPEHQPEWVAAWREKKKAQSS